MQRRGARGVGVVRRALEPDHLVPLFDRQLEGGDHPVGGGRQLLQARPAPSARRRLRPGRRRRPDRGADLAGARVRRVAHRRERRAEGGIEPVHPARGHGDEQRAERVARLGQPPGLRVAGQLPWPPRRGLDRDRRQLPGGHRPYPVHQLVRLVHDHHAVLWQDAAVAERVDGQQRVVGDDDVGLGRYPPRPLAETLHSERTALTPEALPCCHGDLAPRLVGYSRDDLVPVSGRGVVGPLVQPLHVSAERAGRLEQALLVVVGGVAQLVQAQVVVAALEDRELGSVAAAGRAAPRPAAAGHGRRAGAASAIVAVDTTTGPRRSVASRSAGTR